MESSRLQACAFLVAALALGGCSVTRRLAVGQMVPIIENATESARERTDLPLVAQALPANLLLVDGLIRTDPGNAELLAQSAFLNFGYALGFVEPDSLELASQYYATGLAHGLRALQRNKKFAARSDGSLADYERAVANLRRRDVKALAWTTANWGRWISLNLESPAAIAQQPRLEALLARLLQLDPEYEAGLPHALRGMLDALRPQMFGGRPDSAAAHFEKAFQISRGENLLYRVFYAEYYCRAVLDGDCFDTSLRAVLAAADTTAPRFNLMNEIARRRAERLRLRRDEFFD
jgi:hypothetical protein